MTPELILFLVGAFTFLIGGAILGRFLGALSPRNCIGRILCDGRSWIVLYMVLPCIMYVSPGAPANICMLTFGLLSPMAVSIMEANGRRRWRCGSR